MECPQQDLSRPRTRATSGEVPQPIPSRAGTPGNPQTYSSCPVTTLSPGAVTYKVLARPGIHCSDQGDSPEDCHPAHGCGRQGRGEPDGVGGLRWGDYDRCLRGGDPTRGIPTSATTPTIRPATPQPEVAAASTANRQGKGKKSATQGMPRRPMRVREDLRSG
jgi:hypothetical protein